MAVYSKLNEWQTSKGDIDEKGNPAINAQIAVDYRARVIHHDFLSGSANGQSIWNYSECSCVVESPQSPASLHGFGDVGYTLTNKLWTPYTVEVQMIKEDSRYNYLHSKTRIIVERAFGTLKNRFRMLKTPLNQKADTVSERTQVRQMCRVNIFSAA